MSLTFSRRHQISCLLPPVGCLLYTSDAADDLIGVDLGGRRIIEKKKERKDTEVRCEIRKRTNYVTVESNDRRDVIAP